MEKAVQYILTALAVLITLTVHEFSHGYAAYKLGDNTARSLGRLTLNPLKHIDPIGALCMIFFRFGWAKPVPINPRNFKNPRRDFALTALAGPGVNIIMAFVSALLFILSLKLTAVISGLQISFLTKLIFNTVQFIYIFHLVNIGIAVFNLIPVPPLDGSRILNVILPPRLYFKVMRYERITYFILIGWLLLGDPIKGLVLRIPAVANTPPLAILANIFSLSDMIGFVIEEISDGMIGFFSLIFPFLNL
jgi:Zn-dependent protease